MCRGGGFDDFQYSKENVITGVTGKRKNVEDGRKGLKGERGAEGRR